MTCSLSLETHHHSIQPWNQIIVKCYRFLSFAKNISKNIGKNLSGKCKCIQNLLNHAEQSVKDEHKTASKTAIHKTTEATGDLIGSKIVNNITKVWRTSHRLVQRHII